MDAKALLKEQVQTMHGILEAAIGDCSGDACAKKFPNATINSIGAVYAHTIFSEDGILNGMVRGQTPVYYAGGWADKIGVEMPKGGMDPDWTPALDIKLFRQYAAAVYAATDDFLANASDADLDRIIDLGFAPPMSLWAFFANVLVWHAATHQGEVSALKGVQGLNGLDMSH